MYMCMYIIYDVIYYLNVGQAKWHEQSVLIVAQVANQISWQARLAQIKDLRTMIWQL